MRKEPMAEILLSDLIYDFLCSVPIKTSSNYNYIGIQNLYSWAMITHV